MSISRKFSFVGAIVLSWTMGFMLMWIVTGNLGVLPMELLPIAVPWSIVEVVIAVLVARKILQFPHRKAEQGGAGQPRVRGVPVPDLGR